MRNDTAEGALRYAPPVDLHRAEAMRRLSRLSYLLDSAVQIPGTRRSFGLDAVMSVVPGLGTMAGAAVSSYLVYEALRMGAPRPVLARMVRNIALDTLLGAVPLLGPVFDFFYKANDANVKLLSAWLEGRR